MIIDKSSKYGKENPGESVVDNVNHESFSDKKIVAEVTICSVSLCCLRLEML